MLHSDRRVAVMQPYLLPYLGYFQLMSAVDCFVLFDDVHYIQRGWINRNRILLRGEPYRFTLPLRGASQNKLICEIERVDDPQWVQQFLRTLHQAYGRAPYYASVAPLIERVLAHPALHLDEYLRQSLQVLQGHLGLRCELVVSSSCYGNAHLKGQARILDICRQESAKVYVNAIGGQSLYDAAAFAAGGMTLQFLHSLPVSYEQGAGVHVPWLSIVDVLMFNSPAEVRDLLASFELLSGDNRPSC